MGDSSKSPKAAIVVPVLPRDVIHSEKQVPFLPNYSFPIWPDQKSLILIASSYPSDHGTRISAWEDGIMGPDYAPDCALRTARNDTFRRKPIPSIVYGDFPHDRDNQSMAGTKMEASVGARFGPSRDADKS